MFNQSQPQKNTPSLFGAGNSGPSLFSGSSQPSLFSSSNNAPPSSLFGGTQTTSLFGNKPLASGGSQTQANDNKSSPQPQGLFSSIGAGNSGGGLFAGFGQSEKPKQNFEASKLGKQAGETKITEQQPGQKVTGIQPGGLFGSSTGISLFGKPTGFLSSSGIFSSKDNKEQTKPNQKDLGSESAASIQNQPTINKENQLASEDGLFSKKSGLSFGSGGLFGKKEEGSQRPSLFSGIAQPKEPKEEPKTILGVNLINSKGNDETKPESKGLFSGSLFSSSPAAPMSLFAPTKPEKKINQTLEESSKPTSALNPTTTVNQPAKSDVPKMPQVASLFPSTLGSENKEKQQKPSLFGSQDSKGNAMGSSLFGLPLGLASEKKVEKEESKEKQKEGSGSAPINFSFGKSLISPKVDAQPQKKQQDKPKTCLFSQITLKNTQQEQINQVPPPKLTPAINKQDTKDIQIKTIQDKGATSMPASNSRPLFPDKKTETDSKNMVTATTTERTERPKTSQIISSKMTQSLVIDRSIQDNSAPSAPSQMAKQKTATQPFLSTIKPRPIANKQFIDYKTLKEEEKNETFSIYLNQKKGDIIQSIKVYFSVGDGKQKDKQVDPNASEKDRFFTDIANLLLKTLNLEETHYGVIEGFARKAIKQQHYESQLFIENRLVQAYFSSNQIYWQDYSGQCQLNQNSAELKHLIQKIVRKWFTDKTNYINLLFKYPDLIRPKEDLFSYLFKALLKLQQQQSLDQEPSYLTNIVKDHNRLVTIKLVELLEFHNKKLGKSYRLLTDQPDKFIISTLSLIESIKNEQVIYGYLRIVLTALNLQQHQRYSPNLYRAIRETKSLALLPLRVILGKLKEGFVDFAPNPKDLYRFVRGDEWIDWIDVYLQCSQKNLLQLQNEEPSYLVESLTSMNGNLLIDKLITTKKGIFKFFEMLRQQNLVSQYYRLLEACLYNQQSIKEIEEFYFKRVYFNFEYQEIVQYVVHFHENLAKPQELIENSVFKDLQPKISLISKIIQVDPEKLFDLEKYIFYPEFNPNKKFRYGDQAETIQRLGHKLVHVLIDLIKIVSIKALHQKILPCIFKALTALLKNRKTQSIVIAALSITEPCLGSGSKIDVNSQTAEVLAEMLEYVLKGSYLWELMMSDQQSEHDRIRADLFYPFRYNNTQYNKLLSCQESQAFQTFPIAWINELFAVSSKQKFNPRLLSELITKLYIVPSALEAEDCDAENQFGIRRYRRTESNVPKIFQMIVSLVNNYSLWQQIAKILELHVTREQGTFKLFIRGLNDRNPQPSKNAMATLKLLKIVFLLNELLIKYQESCSNHFVIRNLSSLNILNRIEINASLSSQAEKGNILLSLLACVQPEQQIWNDSERDMTWEAQQQEEDNTRTQILLNYLKNNRQCLDFQLLNNFVGMASNRYLQNSDNLTTLALENIVLLLRACPDCSLEYSLLRCWNLNQEQKLQLKFDVLQRLTMTMLSYFEKEEYAPIRYKLFLFIHDLKYNLASNRLNFSLADSLFAEVIKKARVSSSDVRFDRILLSYLSKELRDGRTSSEAFTEQAVFRVIYGFQMRESILEGGHLLKDSKDIRSMLLRYHQKQYSLLNFNQLERVVEQKALIEIADRFLSLTYVTEILASQLTARRYSVTLSRALQALNRVVAEKNLVLLQNDLPFESTAKGNNLEINLDRPRLFLRDSLQLFLRQSKSLEKKAQIQLYQKNNFIEWFVYIAQGFMVKLSNYLQLALTIDKGFYANNPITFQTNRPDLANKEIFCHLSLGTTPLSAVSIFGRQQPDAVGLVQLIAQNLVSRLYYIHQVRVGAQDPEASLKSNYLLGLKLLGFCLQWLRSRQGQGAAEVVRRISRNYQCLLPTVKQLLCQQQMKVLQSYLSLGETIPNHIKYDIHHHLGTLLSKYQSNRTDVSKVESQEDLDLLLQQAFSLYLISPPACNQTQVFDKIINIWVHETKEKYFYHESRLILQLATIYPEEMARLKLLSKLEVIDSSRAVESRYQNQQRKPSTIAWLWAVKVATALVSNSASSLPLNEVTTFFMKHKAKVYKILEGSEPKVTRAYLQDVQGVLELLTALFSHKLWVSVNRPLAEEMVYLMSHQLTRWLVQAVQSPGGVPMSKNQKVLSQVRASTLFEQDQMAEDYRSDHLDNIFQVQIKIKLNYCIRTYCLVMEQAFKISHFVKKYFSECVLESNRYLTSFWDSFNKNLVVLWNYSLARVDYWLKVKRTNHILKLLNDCYHSPHTFFENGYLTTIIDLPKKQEELLADHYLLVYLIAELGTVHYLKQKAYSSSLSSIMVTQGDKFGKRLKEHITKAKELGKKISISAFQYIRQDSFVKLAEIIDNRHLD